MSLTSKKTGVKELDWWNQQHKTVAETGRGGIATAFTGMNLMNIVRGKGVKLSAGKEEHLKRAREVGGAVDLKLGTFHMEPINLAGQGGACAVPEIKLVTVEHTLTDKKGHTFQPGQKVYQRHGTTICPKCGSALRKTHTYPEEKGRDAEHPSRWT